MINKSKVADLDYDGIESAKRGVIAVIPDCREITNVNNSGNSVFYGSSKAAAKQQNFADAVRRLAKQLLEIAPGHEAADVGKEEKGKGIFGRLFLRNS